MTKVILRRCQSSGCQDPKEVSLGMQFLVELTKTVVSMWLGLFTRAAWGSAWSLASFTLQTNVYISGEGMAKII